jgi:hypothetical protein
VQADRKPDLLAGRLVDVLYAHPSDGANRFASLVTPIVSDVAAIDAWWRRLDPGRTLRFDLFPFANCTTTIGALDVADVTLPQPADTFAEDPFQRIVLGLSQPPYRAANRQRKYLVYWDAPVSDARVCGQASATGIAIIYLRACGLTVGSGDLSAAAAAHELIHSLGGVGFGSPHECPRPNEGHVCDDTTDILYPFLNFGLDALLLDVGHDDYYGFGGPSDLRNSPWLERLDVPQLALSVATGGAGKGRVTSDAGGINCPGACTSSQEQGLTMTLTASAQPGSRFTGWTGACTGTGPCAVTLDAAKDVTATFAPAAPVALKVSISGKGRVVSSPAGVSCPGRCSGSFTADGTVALRAIPAKGYRLAAWSGACHGQGACKVVAHAASSVRATFAKSQS